MDEPRARRTDPETSHDAAASIGPERATIAQGHVLIVIRVLGGRCTDEELVRGYNDLRETDMWRKRLVEQSDSGLRTRRKELAKAGKVEEAGSKVRRKNGRDLKHTIWRALSEGEVSARQGVMKKMLAEMEDTAQQKRTEGTLFDPGKPRREQYE